MPEGKRRRKPVMIHLASQVPQATGVPRDVPATRRLHWRPEASSFVVLGGIAEQVNRQSTCSTPSPSWRTYAQEDDRSALPLVEFPAASGAALSG